jgi:hypothetical protein
VYKKGISSSVSFFLRIAERKPIRHYTLHLLLGMFTRRRSSIQVVEREKIVATVFPHHTVD